LEKNLNEDERQEKEKEKEKEKEREREENAQQTIRPSRSPGLGSPTARPRAITPIIEDYSDVGDDEQWQEKFTDFKMKNSVRRGLFHPDDIKTMGLVHTSPGPMTAPLPDVSSPSLPFAAPPSLSSAPSSSSASSMGVVGGGRPARPSMRHGRSPSFAGSSTGDSFDRTEIRRMTSEGGVVASGGSGGGFDKYAETDDDDYDDVFGKANGGGAYSFFGLI
jgi:hypothetical protein